MNHEASFSAGAVSLKSDAGTYLTRCTNCISTGTSPDSAALTETSSSSPATKWTVETYGNQVAFKADTGRYLARCRNCLTGTVENDVAFVHIQNLGDSPYALWAPQNLGNGRWAFKADIGKYLTRCGNCDPSKEISKIAFVDGASSGDSKAQWTVEYQFPSGRVNIQSDLNTLISRCYNCAPGGTAPDAPAIFDTNTTNPKTIWTVEKVGNKVAFKSDNGKYLARCNNCWKNAVSQDSVLVFGTAASDAQNSLWTPEFLGNGKWGFKSNNGKYLVRCPNCIPNAVTPHFAFAYADSALTNPNAQWLIKPA